MLTIKSTGNKNKQFFPDEMFKQTMHLRPTTKYVQHQSLSRLKSTGNKDKQFFIDEMFKKTKHLHSSTKYVQHQSLSRLKEQFMKNNTKYQIYAAESMTKYIVYLKSKNKNAKLLQYINKLIDADFLEIMSQVMATLDTTLLRLLFTLMNYMKLSPKFFEFHRLGPITDSLIRTLNVLLKQYKNRSVTELGLRLLTAILNRPNQKYFIRHIFKENSLLNFIRKLFIVEYGKHSTRCYPDILTYTILLYCDLKGTELLDDIVSISKLSIKSLYKKINCDSFDVNKKAMCVALSCDTISLLLQRLIKLTDDSSLLSVITHHLKTLMKFVFENKAHSLVGSMCRCVLFAYETLEVHHVNQIADHLNKEGILEFLITENNFFRFKNKLNIQKLTLMLLVKQLTILCEMTLSSDTRWQKIFVYGFNKLPSDVKAWSSQIKSNNRLDKVQVTVFSFSYMYYTALPTCFESKCVHLDQLMVIIPWKLIYINHNIDFVYIKIILYLFAVTMTLNYNNKWETIRKQTRPLNQLKRYEDSPSNCEKIYTEHHDFIRWIVSESAQQMPLKLKFYFMTRWITSENTNNMILQVEAEKKRNVTELLLMLLIQCNEPVILPLYNILRSVLQKQKLHRKNERHVRNLVWSNFIEAFNKYKTNESIAFNLISYIYLAIEDPPKFSEHNFYYAISLILTTLTAHRISDKVELHVAFLQFIIFIISELNKSKRTKEINILLSNKHFLGFIRLGLYCDNHKIFTLSIDLISLLDTLRNRSNIVPEVRIIMKANDFNSLMSKDISKAHRCVKLFLIAIPSVELKPFFTITQFSTEIVRQIFFNLISIGITINIKNDQCWRSMSYVLNNHKDSPNLATLPWTPYLIEHTINNSALSLNDIDWMLFLKSWLTALQPYAGYWPGKGFFSHNTITDAVNLISFELVAACHFNSNVEYIHMAKLILNLRTYLPVEIKMKLEEITSKMDIFNNIESTYSTYQVD